MYACFIIYIIYNFLYMDPFHDWPDPNKNLGLDSDWPVTSGHARLRLLFSSVKFLRNNTILLTLLTRKLRRWSQSRIVSFCPAGSPGSDRSRSRKKSWIWPEPDPAKVLDLSGAKSGKNLLDLTETRSGKDVSDDRESRNTNKISPLISEKIILTFIQVHTLASIRRNTGSTLYS